MNGFELFTIEVLEENINQHMLMIKRIKRGKTEKLKNFSIGGLKNGFGYVLFCYFALKSYSISQFNFCYVLRIEIRDIIQFKY